MTLRKFLRLFSTLFLLLSIPVGIYLVGRATGFFGKASGTKANLVINAGSSFPSNFAWKNLAQGGEEKTRMLVTAVDKIKNLNLNYIRIDHVYDFYDVLSTSNGQYSFNWTKLDETLKDIQAMGAKPFLALEIPNLPAWSDWEYIVQKTVEHVSGELKIDSVYYEVWNEPDLFGGWKTYGTKNYFELYSHTVIGANRAVGVLPFKIGGPATTQLYETWSKGFAKFVLANNLRLDFYSWHKYSTTIDNFENNAINAKIWLTESGMPIDLELIISEIGPDSKNNAIYDNSVGAVQTMAAAATLEDSVNKIFNFEIKDGPTNKWGILTSDSLAKPRYDAFIFLNNMTGDSLTTTGQGSWVKAFTKRQDNVIRIFIVNFDPDGKHSEAIPVNVINLPSNRFSYRRIDWNSGVTKTLPSITLETNSWSTMELLNPNTAAILEITPI